MIAVLRDVVEQGGGGAEIHNKGVDLAVIVVVGEACASGNGLYIEHRAGVARDISEFAIAQPREKRLFLRNEVD